MIDIDKMPPKCHDCAYWEICEPPYVCADCVNTSSGAEDGLSAEEIQFCEEIKGWAESLPERKKAAVAALGLMLAMERCAPVIDHDGHHISATCSEDFDDSFNTKNVTIKMYDVPMDCQIPYLALKLFQTTAQNLFADCRPNGQTS